ncbi:MAG TPA: PAM68 family protein [Nodosilinea sp.]|nr:PAM68 family protein [Nodosilinea sp.]
MAPESSRKRLPFEPVGKGADKPAKEPKKADKSTPAAAKGTAKKPAPAKTSASARKSAVGKKAASESTAIPEEVSGRMLRRMLVFSGIPTFSGVLTFVVSYYLVVNRVVELPSYFVLLATLGCFGLGVVGLTYGVLSASWDEGRPGNLLGLDEFKVNFGRMTSAWGAKSDH